METGCYTAIITPFRGDAVDYEGLNALADFQIKNNITGILAVGTTGESPTLSWDEHNKVIENVAKKTKGKCACIAGAGSNNTEESLAGTMHAAHFGADAALLVDPYYNGPSSLEIRKEYIEPVAKAFPEMELISYVIPGRTGAQLLPEDLAILNRDFSNFNTVKEATGNIANMQRTRECCGADFDIFSGDDGITAKIMTDKKIQAKGVISVASNIFPAAVTEMVRQINQGEIEEALKSEAALKPMFDIIMVQTTETTPYGDVNCRARNPSAVKTLMAVLGMPSGGMRKPMGLMSKKGLDVVLEAARTIQSANPELFQPVADFFNVNIEERLDNSSYWENLCYKDY
ncbi:4-hydroxy-tetrahydrodipicolinate synthase [Desulfococcaceae bacterium HSG9]|nr:4-hydroxy-tetrahydrodipicolinate synthase [Desulfococcaceae bacterium HSG9]